jgi:hypothetical protein
MIMVPTAKHQGRKNTIHAMSMSMSMSDGDIYGAPGLGTPGVCINTDTDAGAEVGLESSGLGGADGGVSGESGGVPTLTVGRKTTMKKANLSQPYKRPRFTYP